jgi:hypothetical protein
MLCFPNKGIGDITNLVYFRENQIIPYLIELGNFSYNILITVVLDRR